jgi:hypothetical protein
MEKNYWIARKRAAMAMARGAGDGEARLIHYELAGRYSIKAAHCPPYPLAGEPLAPEADSAGALLHLPLPPREAGLRADPDPAGDGG